MRIGLAALLLLATAVLPAPAAVGETDPFVPHVVVGVADSGFNVYHEVYRRPHLTAHPCTYLRGFSCDLPALELTFDAPTWQAAFEADKAKWAAIKPGDRFWIPGTNIVGAICDQPYTHTLGMPDPTVPVDSCILDDTSMHGTGTTSSVLSENPDALLVVAEGKTTAREHFTTGEFPVDVISHSWGAAAPLPFPCSGTYSCTPGWFEVTASGNEGAFPVVLDGPKSHPNYYNVGAADAGGRTEPGYSGWKTMDFVSEYCRPTAQTKSFNATRAQYCGTSFSAPTFAGALSRVILELRRTSGYDGGIVDGLVDPVLGVSMRDVREALNRTATYEPADKWGDADGGVPLVAPWYQWGWGYFDGTRVDAALACVLHDACPTRPLETVLYMEALWTWREAAHARPQPEDFEPRQDDAGSGRDAPDTPWPDVWVAPGVVYEGTRYAATGDEYDHYAFTASAGQSVHVRYSGAAGQLNVLDASGAPLDDRVPEATAGYALQGSYRATIPADGVYYVRISYFTNDVYGFSYALGGAAPDPRPRL